MEEQQPQQVQPAAPEQSDIAQMLKALTAATKALVGMMAQQATVVEPINQPTAAPVVQPTNFKRLHSTPNHKGP